MMRDYVLNNFWWKLLSLLLAALTWLTIRTALEREQQLRQAPVTSKGFDRPFTDVRITVLTSAANTNHYLLSPTTVSLVISGPEEQLQKLQIQDIHAYVDLSDVGDEKEFRRPIQAQVPGELKVDRIQPPNTTVERLSTPTK